MMFAARALDGMAGGVERMVIAIMNEMVARGHEVSLFSWDRAGARAFYPMHAAIEWHRLDLGDPARKAGVRGMFARAPRVRRMVGAARPQVITCFQGGAFRALKLYTAGLDVALIAAERTAPTRYKHSSTAWNRFVEHQTFRLADCITIQFERYRELYPSYLHAKMTAIPNPVHPAKLQALPAETAGGRFRLLTVGRLSYDKNIEVLLAAFAQLAPRFPDWELRIAGEGETRAGLEAKIAATPELAGRVTLAGAVTDVAAEYAAAHLFCLPSRWEGFPNALAEAMAHGLPAVGFAECAGVSDLIAAGRTGALAAGNNDAATLAAALAALMQDGGARQRIGAAAVAEMARYRPEQVFDLWEETIRACARR